MKKLYALLLFICAYAASATTLTGTLLNPDQSGFTGTLYLSIAQQVGISSLGSCGGPKLVVPTTVVAVNVLNGVMTNAPTVYGASCTLPAGMPYNAVLKDPQGNTMFSTQWLIDGTSQDVGTVFQGPSPIPPTALLGVYMVSSPAGVACSGQTLAIQTSATGGQYLFPCINSVYAAQGGGGGSGGGITIGTAVTGGTANSALFIDGSGNINQDPTNYNYNSSTHTLTLTNPINASILGMANTATSLASTPSICTAPNVAYGINALGNALCRSVTFSDLLPSPAYVTSAATSVITTVGSGSKTVVVNAVPGDAILVDFSFSTGLSGVSGVSVTDSNSATYSNAGLPNSGTPSSTAYLTTNVAGGATTVTVNYTVTGTPTLTIVAADYKNVQTAGPVDGSNVNSGSAITNSGAVTTSVASDLLISPVFLDPQVTVGSTSGYNQDAAFVGIAAGTDLRLFSQLSGAAGSYTSTINFGGTTTSNISLIALKGASSSFPVISVFGRQGAVTAQTGDYSFSQISGTLSSGQLPTGTLTNPMTNIGDIILGGTAGAPTALPIGLANQLLMSNGTTVLWGVPTNLMLTTTVLTATQFPILTGAVSTPGNSLVTTITPTGVSAAACGDATHFCIPVFNLAGQAVSFTSQATSGGIALKTNGIANPVQTILDMSAGPGIQLTNDPITGKTVVTNVDAVQGTPLGIRIGVDWPPTVASAMNDEFTDTIFNTSNIWTIVNQGSDTVTNASSLLSINAVAHSGDNFVGIYQLTPSTPFAVTAKLALTGINATGYYAGLGFRDSATGKVAAMRIGNGSTLTVDYWTNPTTIATSAVCTASLDSTATIYMTLKDDGTNFTFSFSRDGVNFLPLCSLGRTAFLAVPGQVGYIAGSSNATNPMALGSDWFRRTL